MTLPLPEPAPSLLAGKAELAIERAIPQPTRLAELLAQVDVACLRSRDRVTAEALEAAGPRLVAFRNYAVGLDNIDLDAAARHGVYVANTPDLLTNATADFTIALTLAVTRRLGEGDAMVRGGEYDGWRPDLMLGLELDGATLAAIGFGRIGRAVARRAHAFGIRVVYVTRGPPTIPVDLLSARRVSLEVAHAEAHVVSLHAPLSPWTHHVIDAAAPQRTRRTPFLINTSRGALIDERALVRALERSQIAGAALASSSMNPDSDRAWPNSTTYCSHRTRPAQPRRHGSEWRGYVPATRSPRSPGRAHPTS